MHFPLLLVACLTSALARKCVELTGPSAEICAPYSTRKRQVEGKPKEVARKIDLERLSAFYQKTLESAGDWQRELKESLTKAQRMDEEWKIWLGCPALHSSSPQQQQQKEKHINIQYLASFLCISDIFVFSSECNNDEDDGNTTTFSPAYNNTTLTEDITGTTFGSLPQLCDNVCKEYGSSLKLIAESCLQVEEEGEEQQRSNKKKFHPSTEEIETLSHRQLALHAEESCRNILQDEARNFNRSLKCIEGVAIDADSCGFGYDKKGADKFCLQKENAERRCCVLRSQNTNGLQSVLQNLVPPIQFFPDTATLKNIGSKKKKKPGKSGKSEGKSGKGEEDSSAPDDDSTSNNLPSYPDHYFSPLYQTIFWSFSLFFLLILAGTGALLAVTIRNEPRPILFKRHRRSGHVSSSFYVKRDRSRSPRRTLV